jgi:dihydrofolate reductase
MRKIILYIATSLDNYIARKNGSVDWLFHDQDYGYKEFYNSIDTIIMGNNIYTQILEFGDFPYKEKTNFVFTRNKTLLKTKDVRFISQNIKSFLIKLKEIKGKNIWLVGGSQINTLLLNNSLIDEMIIFIHPIVLGEGIPLFSEKYNQNKLKLIETKEFSSGLVQLSYRFTEK